MKLFVSYGLLPALRGQKAVFLLLQEKWGLAFTCGGWYNVRVREGRVLRIFLAEK